MGRLFKVVEYYLCTRKEKVVNGINQANPRQWQLLYLFLGMVDALVPIPLYFLRKVNRNPSTRKCLTDITLKI